MHAGKPPRCAGEHIEARLVQRTVVHAVGLGAPGAAVVLRAVKKALGGEVVEVDEVGVARVRGKRLVGRIAVARGHDGQNLPDRYACLGEEVDERARFCTHGAHAPWRGKRGDGHEDSGFSHEDGSLLLAVRPVRIVSDGKKVRDAAGVGRTHALLLEDVEGGKLVQGLRGPLHALEEQVHAAVCEGIGILPHGGDASARARCRRSP